MVTDFQLVFKRTMAQRIVCLYVLMVWLFCVPDLHQVDSASSEILLKLLEDLEGNYTKPYMRPVNDTTNFVSVGLRFAPVIATLDASKQELTVRGMLALKWTDFRLQWQPEDYDDIKETTIPLLFNGKNKFWIPELSLYESLETDFQGIYPETHSATLTYPGEILWYTLTTTKSYCMMDNKNFPYDHQACNLTFTTWLYQTNEQQFQIIADIVENNTYKMFELPNALWNVELKTPVEVGTRSYQCETCNGESQSFICYHLELRRSHSSLYIWMLALPCIVISILMAYIPFMNKMDGVDVPTYGLTCVLGLFVYLVYLHNALPFTGPALFMGLYITLTVMAGVVAVSFAICGKSVCNDDELDNPGSNKTAVSSATPQNASANPQDPTKNSTEPESGGDTSDEQQGYDNANEKTPLNSKEDPTSNKNQDKAASDRKERNIRREIHCVGAFIFVVILAFLNIGFLLASICLANKS